jgi:hypothetical protein
MHRFNISLSAIINCIVWDCWYVDIRKNMYFNIQKYIFSNTKDLDEI